jgi:hypothetical protein
MKTKQQLQEENDRLRNELARTRCASRNRNPEVTLFTVCEGTSHDLRSTLGRARRDGQYWLLKKDDCWMFGGRTVIPAEAAHLTRESAIEAWKAGLREEIEDYRKWIAENKRRLEHGPDKDLT